MRPSPAVLAVVLVTLAGCSDGAAPPQTEGPQVRDVEPDAASAAISGVVVDETIRPVEGATVVLATTGGEVMTAEDGTFVFEDVETGFHALEASAEGYLTVQTTVEVVAGAVAKPRMMLPRDTSPQPYHQSHQFAGHMVLSDYIAVWIVTGLVGNTEFCACMFEFSREAGLKTVVMEGVWESSTPRVEEHDMYWEMWGEGSYEGTWSTSPLQWHIPGTSYGEDMELTLQVSSGEQPDVEQDFEGFLTFFYVEPAPDGWSLVGGDR